jgi:hypothetical protein
VGNLFDLELVTVDGRPARRGWSRRALALLAGVALALSAGAVTAAPASAWSPVTNCTIVVKNNTPYRMQLYNEVVYGLPTAGSNSISPMSGTTFDAVSTWPINTHCSINLAWELQTADSSGWSQALETYVYDPNSGRNGASSSATGDFAARATATAEAADEGALEAMGVSVNLNASGASGASAAGLRAGGDPLRRAADSAAQLPEPKQVPSLLHRGDLIGRGWRRATQVRDLGHLGRILSAAKVPASCRDKNKASEPSPQKEGLSAFTRRSSAEFIGAGQSSYAHASQARRTLTDAGSVHSVGCLARLLTSRRFHTSVNIQRRSVTFAGRRLILNRLKVSTHSGARVTRTDYIDFAGVLHGKANALLMFASNKRPPELRGEVAAIGAVVDRLP